MIVTIEADPQPFVDALRALSKPSKEVVDSLPRAIDAGAQIVRLDLNCDRAIATPKLRISLQPSDFMLGFVTALRARNGN